MIYLDTSVALAQLFAEDRRPPAALWNETLVSSRLLEYELWSRIHARRLGEPLGTGARRLVSGIGLIELVPAVLARALKPFPRPVGTLDGLHLASVEFLRGLRQEVALATYDVRMAAVAEELGIPLYRL
ncbi:MAG: PIN domain-containing protein [Acidobacteria bacterium]|nr:PIN domain-containing protein [Acidobacteriota bacterium]